MNYLAHAFLSGNSPDLLVGNFIADHVRGNDLKQYPESIIKGILLHRKIDTFTDQHPEFRKSKRIFYDGFEKHSGILVDIYFDYFLAKDFKFYSQKALTEFSQETYAVYMKNLDILPVSSSRFLQYVLKNNIYTTYAELDGIERVLYHLSERIRHNVRLESSVDLLMKHQPELQGNFNIFFKDAQQEFSI